VSINDFKNTRGVNSEDPIYDKDVVNLRTLRRIINSSTSGLINYCDLERRAIDA
jgi:hypothetical protein